MIWSSVTSRMRPGQFAARGRASRSMRGIGIWTSAETGTLTASFMGALYSAKSSQSPSAVRITRAHERFGTDEVRRSQLDLRLVPEIHPVVPQHRAERNRRFRIGVRHRS